MMKTILILPFILCQFSFLYGQSKVQGYVLDANTHQPLTYATIGAVYKNYGCYSDTAGFYTLYFFSTGDSLKISYVGYEEFNTTVKDLSNNPRVFLEPTPVDIEEAIIRTEKAKYKEFDVGHFTKKIDLDCLVSYPINVWAIYIPFPREGKDLFIKSIKFAYQNAFSFNCPVRVQILRVDKNGKPGNIILSKNVEINKSSRRLQKAIVEISDEHIYFPKEGVFVAIEWIIELQPESRLKNGQQFSPYIGAIKVKEPKMSYLRVLNQPKWIEVQSKNVLTIGLTVKKYD